MSATKKYRHVKNRRLMVDEQAFVYSIIAYEQVVKVRFYHERKTPFLEIAFDYPALWSVDIYRPKILVELLRIHGVGERAIGAGLTVVTPAESAVWVPRLALIEPPQSLG
ncbi:MAG: hypothetical protein KBC57_01060 [Neisseriaceae bacterium]|nr:hypothetical protein [Neisseriaceae bacterium]MBP6860929.1 hypothetical protein [Neisseriaceae bacterium]